MGAKGGTALFFSSALDPSPVGRKVQRVDPQLPLASWPRALTAGRDGPSVGRSPVSLRKGTPAGMSYPEPPKTCEGHSPATERSRGPGPHLPFLLPLPSRPLFRVLSPGRVPGIFKSQKTWSPKPQSAPTCWRKVFSLLLLFHCK